MSQGADFRSYSKAPFSSSFEPVRLELYSLYNIEPTPEATHRGGKTASVTIRCVLASLYEGVSVGWMIRPSVGNRFLSKCQTSNIDIDDCASCAECA